MRIKFVQLLRTFNRYFKTALLIIILLTCWSVWLPYFVPIFTIQVENVTYVPARLYEPAHIVFDAAAFKYLPCTSTRSNALFISADREAVPIHLENFYTHKTLGQGLFKNSDSLEYPLWETIHSRIYAELPDGYTDDDVAGGYFLISATYHCSKLENDYDKSIIFPRANYEALHASVH